MVKAILERNTADLVDLHRQIVACFSSANAQEARVAEMFAAVALAGEIAAMSGIVPWNAATSQGFSDSDSVNAAVALFNRWKENRESAGRFSSEHTNMLLATRVFTERHGGSRFMDITAVASATPTGFPIPLPIIRDLAGYWKDLPTGRIYLFTKGGLREATKGYDLRRVLKALEDAGAFTAIGYGSEKAKNRRTPYGQMKLYHIEPEKLQ